MNSETVFNILFSQATLTLEKLHVKTQHPSNIKL